MKTSILMLIFASVIVYVHETTWLTAPYWLPWFKAAIAAIGSPWLAIMAGLLTISVFGYLNRIHDESEEMPSPR